MYSQKIIVENEEGLHARPAAKFVQTGSKFQSGITILKGQKKANAKSILQVMSLSITKGTEIIVCAEGPDEEQAVLTLIDLIKGNFN
jgi:phosphocarrier protein